MTETTNKKELLNVALVHEFHRCTQAFNSFAFAMALLPKNDTKSARIYCFNTYVDFLSHLYEFYIPLIENELKKKVYKECAEFKDKRESEQKDLILTYEVAKLFKNRKNRIVNGYQDTLGHRVDFYDCEIPKEFGKHLRTIRHRRNHVDYKRASNDFDISLKDFFERYHKFVIILHEESRWLYQVDENNFDWKVIDDFATEILK